MCEGSEFLGIRIFKRSFSVRCRHLHRGGIHFNLLFVEGHEFSVLFSNLESVRGFSWRHVVEFDAAVWFRMELRGCWIASFVALMVNREDSLRLGK